ncbi:hypothetical protein [Thermocladium modestius]|nr:hypothetical protein [Thermocladium modestius]
MDIALLDDCRDRFVPISYTTPTPFLITGGLRLVEHWMIRLGKGVGLDLAMQLDEAELHLSRNELLLSKWWGYEPRLSPNSSTSISACVLPTNETVAKVMEYVERGARVVCGGEELIHGDGEAVEDCSLPVLRGAWDLIKFNHELLLETIPLLGRGDVVSVDSKIRDAHLDTSSGPIAVIGANIVNPVSIKGPALVGPDCELQSFTLLRPGSVLYWGNVVGGEVKNSVLDKGSRKPHHGYLGDSYLGKWINLGAGTSVSNLKNTLGHVRFMGRDTGMSKLGPIIGDWVRSGINSSIMTGKAVGPGSHVYGLVSIDVPPFVFFKNYGEPVMSQVNADKLGEIIRRSADGDEREARLASMVYEATGKLRIGIGKFNFKL